MEEDMNLEKSYGGEMLTQEMYKPPTLTFSKSPGISFDPNSAPIDVHVEVSYTKEE